VNTSNSLVNNPSNSIHIPTRTVLQNNILPCRHRERLPATGHPENHQRWPLQGSNVLQQTAKPRTGRYYCSTEALKRRQSQQLLCHLVLTRLPHTPRMRQVCKRQQTTTTGTEDRTFRKDRGNALPRAPLYNPQSQVLQIHTRVAHFYLITHVQTHRLWIQRHHPATACVTTAGPLHFILLYFLQHHSLFP